MNPIILIAGVPVAIGILLSPFFGLLLTVFLMPQALIQALGGTLFGIFTMATPIKIVGGLTFLSVFVRQFLERKKTFFFKTPPVVWFLLFLVWIFISGFSHPGSFTRENFTMFTSFGMFGFIALSLISNLKKFRAVIWVSFLAMFIVCLKAIFDFAGSEEVARTGGTGYGPNEFAIGLLPFIGLSFYSAFSEKNGFLKFLLFVLSGLCVLALVATFSRGGIIGLGAMGAVAVLIIARHKIRAIIVVSVLAVLFVTYLPPQVKSRFERTQVVEDYVGDEAIDSTTRRYNLALAAWRMFLDNPIVGVGVGNYYWECGKYAPVHAGRAHNMYLEIMAELGIIGIFLFLGILFSFFKSIRRIIKNAPELAGYAKGLALGLIGFLAAAIFLHAQQEKALWFVIFMGCALEAISKSPQAAERKV